MRSKPVGVVLVVDGVIGFFLGAIENPRWQDALEPAQVLAGLVRYAPQNPIYVYSMGTWTFLHQALAMLFRLGASEEQLAMLVSGVIGMVFFQALGVLVLAISEDAPLAVFVPFLVHWSHVTNPYTLMNSMATYGVVGLIWTLLAIGLIAAGLLGSGGLLLGFGFAVHPAWGLWSTLAVAVAIATDRRRADWLRRLAPFFLVGLAIAAASAATHYLNGGFSRMPRLGPPDAYLAAFKDHWDYHRSVVGLHTPDMNMATGGSAFVLFWMWRFPDDVPPRVALALKALVASVALGAILSLSYRLPATWVPEMLLALDPSRQIGLGQVAGTAIVFGVAGRFRRDPALRWLVAILGLILCIAGLQEWFVAARIAYDATAAAAVLFIVFRIRRGPARRSEDVVPPAASWVRAWLAAPALAMVFSVITAARSFPQSWREAFERDPAFVAASQGRGLLVTAGTLHMIQLQTRRPVLFDGFAMDAVNYVPAAAPEMVHILKDVYGVDFLRPSGTLAGTHGGSLEPTTAKELWQSRTAVEWHAIGEEFGVTEILTPADWSLALPLSAKSAHYLLYSVDR